MTEQYSECATCEKLPQNESLVWDAHEITEASHHVFGLTCTKNGTIMAFTEARLRAGDEAPHHLALRRGRFDGQKMAWEETQLLEKSERGECWSNPATLYDHVNNRVFVFYVYNEGSKHQVSTQVYYRFSDDEGKTWSERVDVSDAFAENPYGWTFNMPGPGHGIQLRHQKNERDNGRLIMQFWHRKAVTANPRCYGNSLLYSDDFGKTWQMGATPGLTLNMNESRIEELANGTLVLNSRGGPGEPMNTTKIKIRTLSKDGGMSFEKPEICPGLEYCGCDGGMLHIGDGSLLMSLLADKEERRMLTLYKSIDHGLNWEEVGPVHPGAAQYSDLVRVDEKYVGILYGQGCLRNQPVIFSLLDLKMLQLE